VTEVMKQKQYAPQSVAQMALAIYSVNNGYMDKVVLNKVVAFEAALQAFAGSSFKSEMAAINTKPELKSQEATLKKICEEFAKTGSY
jgi:F-type H+-transporting ATPase subunit alpha